jgi:peroxiredoxin
LARLNPQIDDINAKIVVVTMGKPDETAAFCAERAPGVNCFADPEATSYRLFGLARGNAQQLFGPAVWLRGAQVTVDGTFDGLPIGKPVGDPFQMPGVFVIDTNGRVQMAYYSKHAGDYPDDAVLVNLAKGT